MSEHKIEQEPTIEQLKMALLVSRRETMAAHTEILNFQMRDLTVEIEKLEQQQKAAEAMAERNT